LGVSWELYDPEEGEVTNWNHIFKMWVLWILLTLCVLTVLS